jgi:hypothetical protein
VPAKKTFSFLLVFFCFKCYGQKDSSHFLKQINLSFNRTNVENIENNKMENRNGFGAAAYTNVQLSKAIIFVTGLEYNYISFFKKHIYDGHFSSYSDITYSIHYLSLPLVFRITAGNKIKFFLSPGVFIDILAYSRMSATHSYSGPGYISYSKDVNEPAGISILNVGYMLGIGMMIPLSKYYLVVTPEFKKGLPQYLDPYDMKFDEYFRLAIGLKLE